MHGAITPFRVEFEDAGIEDLRARLARTRWPEPEPVADWSQGVPSAYLHELCDYWAGEYDMGRLADRLGAWPQFRTEIDGLGIHFIHARSTHPEAVPLLLTHGWPGSVVEFLKVIGPLVDPPAHGGDAADAFHVVCPSLPGYGFSDKPAATGWGIRHIAAAWAELMARLGYERYVAQGGDWGSSVTVALAAAAPEHVAGIHLNFAVAAQEAVGEPTAEEAEGIERLRQFAATGNGYAIEQSTKPQTVGYALVDSPAGQCAWIVEKFEAWSDCDGHPENSFTRDELLDNVTLYWLTASAASSARLYWESFSAEFTAPRLPQVPVPAAYTRFPEEIVLLSERLARSRFPDLRYYNRAERGGHFAALEAPDLFVAEVRAGIRATGAREMSGAVA
jgi:pimeloyl-ACP methyl ester carboxylesterase